MATISPSSVSPPPTSLSKAEDESEDLLEHLDISLQKERIREAVQSRFRRDRDILAECRESLQHSREQREQFQRDVAPQLKSQIEKLEQVFERIDRLEIILGVVREAVKKVTARVEEAESGSLQKANPLKNMLSSLSKFQRKQRIPFMDLPAWEPLEIYDSNDYFPTPREIPPSDEES